MFWNKNAVQKIKELRKARKEGMSDEEFEKSLEEQFGHKLGEKEEIDFTEDDIKDLIKDQEEKELEGLDHEQLEDLDEIRIVKPTNLDKDASQQ